MMPCGSEMEGKPQTVAKRTAPYSEEPRKQFKRDPSQEPTVSSHEPPPADHGATEQDDPHWHVTSQWPNGIRPYNGTQCGEVDRLQLMIKSLEEDIIKNLPADEGMLREFPEMRLNGKLQEARKMAHTVLNGLLDEREEYRSKTLLETQQPEWYQIRKNERAEPERAGNVEEEAGSVHWSSGVVVTPAPRSVQNTLQPQPSCSFSFRQAYQ